MPYTFANLKREIRAQIWPAGEARNQFVAHNASFVQGMTDIMTWVECQQIDNTQLVPHCATFFNCGLTWFDQPRGIINQVSTIEKVDEDGEPDAEGEDDWCSEIFYSRIDYCHIERYLTRSTLAGCCLNLPIFFAIPTPLCGKGNVPVPTDEGLPAGLPVLPLGNDYPQESTDADSRAKSGVWALNRGRLYVAPWIQSTETVVVRWDGIKRDWADGDLVDEDPKLKRAIEMYVRIDHARKFELDEAKAQAWERQYNLALSDLIHDCRQETMKRDCRESHARGSRSTALYYNDAQQYTATCPPDKEGDPVTVTIAADTVGSSISKTDANEKALEQARTQAEAQLDCVTPPVTYWNEQVSATASCEITEDHPLPEGSPVTVTIPAGQYSSTVSQLAANQTAQAAAEAQAQMLLECTYWNKEVEYTAECPEGSTGDDVTVTIAEHTHSSEISQLIADQEAENAAKTQAEEALVCTEVTVYYNTAQSHNKTANCAACALSGGSTALSVTSSVPAGYMTSIISQADANQKADDYARLLAEAYWTVKCLRHECGSFFISPEA